MFAVADGMGGHRAGEVASALAVDLLRARLAARRRRPRAGRRGDRRGQRRHLPGRHRQPRPAGHGHDGHRPRRDRATGRRPTTTDRDDADGRRRDGRRRPAEQLALVNVGDSRTYLLRHGRLRRVTVDHSYVQELVATGHITDDEARTHPRRNIVTRALGIDPAVRVDAWTLPLVRGDRFLLCSDGLVDEVRDDEIVDVLHDDHRPPGGRRRARRPRQPPGRPRQHHGRSSSTSLDGAEPPDPDTELDLEPAWDGHRRERHVGRRRPRRRGHRVRRPRRARQRRRPGDRRRSTSRRPRRRRPTESPTGRRRRRRRAAAAAADAAASAASPASSAALGVLAVLVLAFVIAAAWARRGYFVAFDDARRRRDLPRPERRLPVVRSDRGGTDRLRPRRSSTSDSIDRVEREPELRLPPRRRALRRRAAGRRRPRRRRPPRPRRPPRSRPPRPRRRPPRRDGASLGAVGTADGAALTMAATSPIARARRSTELSLVVMAGLITAGAYTLASLGEYAVIPARIVPFLAVLLGLLCSPTSPCAGSPPAPTRRCCRSPRSSTASAT